MPHDDHQQRALGLTTVGEGSLRIRFADDTELSPLERYRIITLAETDPTAADPAAGPGAPTATVVGSSVEVTHSEHRPITVTLSEGAVTIDLDDDERLYGLGDVDRDTVQRRGQSIELWVQNVAAYGPMPFVMSSAGWGVFVNTTRRARFDLGATDADRLTVTGLGSNPDVVVMVGSSMTDVLRQYTALVGRPALMPLSAYGLTYVCNQQADARAMLDEALRMREHDIPCDTIGLEPGWMETRYDYTTEKRWHPERFDIPHWMLDTARQGNWGDGKHHTFFGALERLNFRLSLWLCCDYDLSHEAERRALGGAGSTTDRARGGGNHADDIEQDQRLSNVVLADTVTKPNEPWFEHLKKFVDQGAAAFKLDGANQVMEHPDRLWANGMRDDQMHNLYPALLAQQMFEGFTEHTGRRPHIYTAASFAGTAQFAATWAGDTGGGPRPLVSMLNHGLSGHSNTSCDMDVFTPQGIHFGFLQPWSQICSWAYWRQPWLLGEELEPVLRSYAQLRYRLLPYLYSAAWTAHTTGLPILRAMALAFPDDPATHESRNQYMLGDAFLVSAFTDEVVLPAGGWTDYWTGERHEGPGTVTVPVDGAHGGALLVRDGSLVPTWPDVRHTGRIPGVIRLDYFAGHAPSELSLHEDDGTTTQYAEGRYATTVVRAECDGSHAHLSIAPRDGSHDGMPSEREFEIRVHASGAVSEPVRIGEDPQRRTPATLAVPLPIPSTPHHHGEGQR